MWIDSEAEEEIDDLWARCSGSEAEGEVSCGKKSKVGGWREKQVGNLAGYCNSCTSSVILTLYVISQEAEWVEKLLKADRPKTRKRKKSVSSPRLTLKAAHLRRPPPFYAQMKDATNSYVAGRSTILEQLCDSEMVLADMKGLGLSSSCFRQNQQTRPLAPLDCKEAEEKPSTEHGTLAPPVSLPALCAQGPRSTLINSGRSCTSALFIEPSASSPCLFYWTTLPRRSVEDGLLPFETRMHSVHRVLEQAGYARREDDRSQSLGLEPVREYRSGAILTERLGAKEMVDEIRKYWTRPVAQAKVVWICDVAALQGLAGQGSAVSTSIEGLASVCGLFAV